MIDLKDYGYTKEFENVADYQEGVIPARITEVHRDFYKVAAHFGEGNAVLKGSMRNQIAVSEDYPAVGDFVLIKYNEQGASTIINVLARKSKFSRPDYSGHAAGYVKTILEQVVAANFDYVFILASLNNDFNINRILRYITVSLESGGIPVVLLTKADLAEDFTEQQRRLKEQAIGVDILAVSAVTGFGLRLLDKYLQPGKTIVFLGSSGVGKSTLVNALAGEEVMQVNSIREDDSKGRHTTTHRQLIMLKSGVMVIDTPGMRELGMWEVKEGLGEVFTDVEELFAGCRFSNCTHRSEPGCAVLAAIENHTLEMSRWKNYLQLKAEAKFTEDKAGYHKEKKEFFKKINKTARAGSAARRKAHNR